MKSKTLTRQGCSISKFSRFKTARHRGSVLLLIAFGLVMLCGFTALAVDYGRSVLTKNQLQRACDAAALAAVDWLPNQPENARKAAIYWAWQNGQVNVNASGVVFSNNNSTIRVSAARNVKYFFAPLMKIISGDVNATATAALVQTNNLTPKRNSVVPIGITPATYKANMSGNLVWLKGIRQNKESLGLNELVLFDLRNGNNGKSPSQMQGQLQWNTDYDEVTSIGDYEQTLNAARPAQTKFFGGGINSRITEAAKPQWADDGQKFTKIPPGSPRLVYVILTPESQPVNGNNYAEVKGFVPVYIVDYYTDDKDGGPTVGDEQDDSYNLLVRMLPLDYNAGGTQTPVTNPDPALAAMYLKRLIG